MAKNDWIVAGLNNPDFTPYDFSTIADLTLDNTQMLSKDEYLKSDFIKNHDMFKDESGKFSENKFNQYYQYKLNDFREFQEQEFPKGPQLDMFDTDKTKDSRVKDIRFEIGRHVNPDRQAVGIEGVRVWSDPTQTKSEIAQSQKIWDTKKQEFKDYSSNDKALVNGVVDWVKEVFSDPLVMAQWEEDGEHIDPITGLTRTHSKGDYKLNEKGTYYYETLGDRSAVGKEVLSVFDTLTVDGEGINKYDFFDSDDIEKSATGIIAKNVAALIPLFTPIGTAYSWALIAKEFSKALPMLYSFATILGDSNETPKWINNAAAFGAKMSTGTSQYAKENTFSFENFGNLIADVALQWGQQKAIAEGINKLRKSTDYIKKAQESAEALYKVKSKELGASEELWEVCKNKFLPEAQKMATQASQLGRDISMAYMAIVSNSDLYNDMRNQGLSKSESAAIALGSTLGMFGLNKYTGLGEIFFDDATDDAVKMARIAIKEEMKDAKNMFTAIKNSNLSEPNKLLKFIKTASSKAENVMSKFSEGVKYHTLNFTGKALGEGLEEVSEEIISDVSKQIYELAGQFGFDTTSKDVGAWDDALERYSMSFIGGAIGGGIFYGKEALIDGKSYKRDIKNQEIQTLIRNGHANELRSMVKEMMKKGKLGNTKLSASKYETDEKGNQVWLTTDNIAESQNNAIGNAILYKINALEEVINQNRIGLSDEQLFENMVLTEKRYKRYEKIAPLTNYYQDFNNIVKNLIAAELDFKKASQTIEGTVNGRPLTDAHLTSEQEASRQEQLLKLKEAVDKYRKQKDEFLAGDTSLEYTRKLNFIMDPMLHSQYLSIDMDQFFAEQYGDRKPEELNPEELIKFQLDWQKKLESTLKEEVDQSWQKFKEHEQLIIPELIELEQETPTYKKFSKDTETLFGDELSTESLFQSYANYDTKLDTESDEDFEFRNSKLIIDGIEESDEQFQLRKFNRWRQIDEYNTQKDQEWADKVTQHLSSVGYKVDPFTFRFLRRAMPQRQKDIVERKISFLLTPPNIKQIFKQLKPDLSNIDEVKEVLYKSIYQQKKLDVSAALNELSTMELKDADGDTIDINEYIAQEEDGSFTIQEIVDDPSLLTIQDGKLVDILKSLIPVIGGDITLSEVVQSGSYLLEGNSNFEDYVKNSTSVYENDLQTLVTSIKTNPIYNLSASLNRQIKNPIGELIKRLSQKNGDEIPNVDGLLDQIQDDFENIDDANQLILDDTQMSNLKKVKDYLKLLNGFMYAASSNPDKRNPYGHNQVINSFARTHKDTLLKEWAPLPEIDSDYFILYNQAIAQYASEIDYWIGLSNNNNVNKIRKFVATDRAFNIALLESTKDKNLKINIDDEEINLLDGFVDGDIDPEVNLFNAEKVLYKNFKKAVEKSGLSVYDFLVKTKLLEQLVPSISNIANQQVAGLSESLRKENLTDFDLVQYFAQIFALNPSDFYTELRGKVKNNDKIAPITAQEYSSKLAKAITTETYRSIMKYAYEKSGSKLPYLHNTLIIPGVAGAGKTAVVLASVNSPDEEVIVAGPTENQAKNLQKALGRTSSYTFKQLLEKILGIEQYNAIQAELQKIDNTKGIKDYNCEYFTVEEVNGVAVIKLKEGSLRFNTLEKTPKKLFLDEATHLNSLEAQIIDAFAKSIGAVNYFAGDLNQRGAFIKKAGIENLQEDSLFSSRAPKLSISLRDNNLQKYLNQENVRSVLDTVNENVLKLSSDELKQFWPRILNSISKFNFKVYNHEELNGDLITPDLTDELINKLKTEKFIEENGTIKKIPVTIGFVGSKSSQYLQKLKDAGIDVKVMSMDEMQGDEFDYVIIDHDWENNAPDASYKTKIFLTDLYTAMTRARTASIFIDRGLSKIIGKNVLSNNKSKAPSILDGVKELREKKLAILDKFQLEFEESKPNNPSENTTSTNITQSIEQPSSEPAVVNPDEDFIDPDNKNIDPDASNLIQKISSEEQNSDQELIKTNFAADGEQVVETFTDVTILSATQTEKQKHTVKYNGKDVEIEAPTWKINIPKTGSLRNLQALYDNEKGEETELIKYTDKQQAQQYLFDIKSSIIYQHAFKELPDYIQKRFKESDWEKGTLEIEVREATNLDITHLNAKYDESGFEYNGKRYIVNIVFSVKTKSGRIAKFDISGLPNPETYKENLETIKKNLQARINSSTGDDKIKLQEKLNNTDATFTNYKKLLKQWIAEYVSNGSFSYQINSSMLHFNKTTWFSKLQQSDREDGIQLGGKLNPITGERTVDTSTGETSFAIQRSRKSLMLNHPELVFSPIYTYASNDNVLNVGGMDNTIKGKAVIFVTSDTLLSPNELLAKYKQQKTNLNTETARVRMLVLDNYGMRFSQFIDNDFIRAFQASSEERKPFRQNYTGIRMFTSLWNWRAGLIRFNEAVAKWQSDNKYSDRQVEVLIESEQKLFDKEDPTVDLQTVGLSIDDVHKIAKFNTEDCKDIPMFRLGYAKNKNGFYVRANVDVKGSLVYNDKEKVNLAFISPAKSKQFEVLINRILSSIEPNEKFPNSTLGLKLIKPDGSDWGKDELIDLKDATHRRALSGLLKSDENGKMILHADGQNLMYGNDDYWSMIPALISNVVKTITYLQHHSDELTGGVQTAKITIQDKSGNKDENIILETQVDDLFHDGYLQTGYDPSLFNLLNLVFHGTTDDIHKKLTKGTSLLQVEDAYFKHGFYISPDISRKKGRAGDSEIISDKDVDGKVLFYAIETTPELFTVDTDVRTSGIGLKIDKLFETVKEEQTKEEEIVKGKDSIEEFKQKHPNLSTLIDLKNTYEPEWEFDSENINELINWYNDTLKDNIKTKIKDKDTEVLDRILYVQWNDDNNDIQSISLKEYISVQLNSDTFTSEFNEGLIIKYKDKVYKLNDDLKLEEIKTNPTKSKYSEIGEELLQILGNEDERKKIISSFEKANEDNLIDLGNALNQIFNSSNNDDEEISKKLEILENTNTIYTDVYIQYLNDNYPDLVNKLYEC